MLEAAELLTRREVETVRLLGQGQTNKEIAAALHLSVATVKNHVHAVLSKLQLTRRAQVSELLRERPWLLGARAPGRQSTTRVRRELSEAAPHVRRHGDGAVPAP